MPLGTPEPVLNAADFGTGADDRPRLSETVAGAVFIPQVLTERSMAGAATEALGAPDWTSFAASVTGDPSPYQQAVGPNLLYEQIYDALSYNLLTTELERVFQGLERARGEAQSALQTSVETVSDHQPHYGLFLAFLDLLAVAREDLNGLTARHLDFYYREVLRMAPRGPVPASAHVLFSLARRVDAHLLNAGSELRAGKDALGNEVRFALTDDIVVNRGLVAERRAIRVHSAELGGDLYQSVFASPVADSRDGLGGPLDDDALGWRPFGPLPWPEGATEAQAPPARVGFAIADPRLFMREGARELLVSFECDAPIGLGLVAPLRGRFTGPEGWYEADSLLITDLFGSNTVVAYVALDGDQPPIVPYAAAIHADDHGAGYQEGLPVAEFTLPFAGETDLVARAFALLRDARLQSASMVAYASNLRSLSFLTPDGVGDPSKPFAPFGARPDVDAPLVIGSAELFSKRLDSLDFDVVWDKAYAQGDAFRDLAPSAYDCAVSYLNKGAWQPAASALSLNLDQASPDWDVPDVGLADPSAAMSLDDPVYGAESRSGFIRLELGGDFGHRAYPSELTRATIAIANQTAIVEDTSFNYTTNPDSYAVPNEPFTPTLREITARYVTVEDTPAYFYHVAPFGQAERVVDTDSLLPALDYEAALFAGIQDFESPARLQLLAQVANGSGDPLLEVPELQFHFLAGDQWQAFLAQDVDDKSDNLAASAVLGLALPKAADLDHRLMPGGLHWIRISVARNAAAVNSLLDLRAQGARAEFSDRGNDPQFLSQPLAAGTIGKLAVPETRIKQVEQPFASFGGAPQESDSAFRQRSAERLRHKDRASTLWDYERLALEAAPELYRVKCLNHTELVRENGAIVADNELSPGAVVVVTVPWTTGRPHLDPLRPYTDQATIKNVRARLADRISPFVRLEVANPKFEEVQVSFKVAFHDGIDDVAFYLNELEQAVIGHLAPWSVSEGADITFGGKLRKSVVIDFVEELGYVNYLEDFEMYHRPNPESAPWTPVDMETIEATTARSILVSAPRHLIERME